MSHKSALRRRNQKQPHGQKQSPQKSSVPNNFPVNSDAEALNQRIHRLELAQRRIKIFNKVALCVACLCLGNNIFALVSNRRRGGGFSVLGEAFQSKDAFGKIQSSNRYNWPMFVSRRVSNDRVPRELLQPFGSYPNVLNITSEMRKGFHPVVKIPLRKGKRGLKPESSTCESESQQRSFWPWRKGSSCNSLEQKLNETYDYIVKDYTGNNKNDSTLLLEGGERVPQLLSTREEALEYAKLPKQPKPYDVGRYDENRQGMYTSSLFVEEGNIDEKNRRTVHIGLDIGAPVGCKVHAFTDGVVHSAGYNSDVGDYGHVIVIEHHLKNHDEVTKVYALYGHLGSKSIQGKSPGQKIKKGQVIGYLGNTAENGGWTGAHVHFQLAVHPPPTHDMPGVVTLDQREEALLEYPDPRFVLGELY